MNCKTPITGVTGRAGSCEDPAFANAPSCGCGGDATGCCNDKRSGCVTLIETGVGLTGGPIVCEGRIGLDGPTQIILGLAETALQPGDDISELVNNVGFLTDAPSDGEVYGRSNDDWVVIDNTGGGVAGPPGPQGPPGPPGVDGVNGADGAPGPAGPTGNTGPQGNTGPAGPTGLDGAVGPSGPAGADGAAGAQGPVGAQGPTGPAGATGEKGDTGAPGPAGPEGPAGEAGSGVTIRGTLPAGAPPPVAPLEGDMWIADGALSGWVTAAAGDGVVWSGTDWTNVGPIRGPQGATGQQGLQGVPGPQGPLGPQGGDGPAGPQGAAGPQGPTGPQGPQGAIALTTKGDLLSFNGSAQGRLPVGTATQVLGVDASAPLGVAWRDEVVSPVGGLSLNYQFDVGTAAAGTGVGDFRLNNASQPAATQLFINATTNPGNDASVVWDNLSAGDFLSLWKTGGGADVSVTYRLTSNPTAAGAGATKVYTMGVVLIGAQQGVFANNNAVIINAVKNPATALPPGGLDGQVLTKQSATDYDVAWEAGPWVLRSGDTMTGALNIVHGGGAGLRIRGVATANAGANLDVGQNPTGAPTDNDAFIFNRVGGLWFGTDNTKRGEITPAGTLDWLGSVNVAGGVVAGGSVSAGGNVTALSGGFQSALAFGGSGGGVVLGDEGGVFLRPNGVGTQVNQAVLNSAGQMTLANGLSMGAALAPSSVDLSRHISLFGGNYGFNVVAPAIMQAVINGVPIQQWDALSGVTTFPNGVAFNQNIAVAAAINVTGAIQSSGPNLILAGNGNGVFFRPLGEFNASGQAYIGPTGDVWGRDAHLVRPAAPVTGAIFLGDQSAGSRYLFWDGTRYEMPGGRVDVQALLAVGRVVQGIAGGQGFEFIWNTADAAQGRNEYINNRGAGAGGHLWYTRPQEGDALALQMSLTGAGDVVATGSVSSRSRNVSGLAGTVGALSGFQTVWNNIAPGAGATEFINNREGGAGGFLWYNRVSTGSPIGPGNLLMQLDSAGGVTAANFVANSDARLKDDIVYEPARERLASLLKFATWLWKADGSEGQGLIAQDVQEVAPEYVHVGVDGHLAIDKASLALECVIGLAARVAELEKK